MMSKKPKEIPQGKSKGLNGSTIYRRENAIYIEVAGKPVKAKDFDKYLPK